MASALDIYPSTFSGLQKICEVHMSEASPELQVCKVQTFMFRDVQMKLHVEVGEGC